MDNVKSVVTGNVNNALVQNINNKKDSRFDLLTVNLSASFTEQQLNSHMLSVHQEKICLNDL